MTTDKLLDDIREANTTYLILAQALIRRDKAEALYRLGINEQVADLIANLSAGQIFKIAASNMLLCHFRFEDEIVWNLLTSHGKDSARNGVGGIHAAILMANKIAEAA